MNREQEAEECVKCRGMISVFYRSYIWSYPTDGVAINIFDWHSVSIWILRLNLNFSATFYRVKAWKFACWRVYFANPLHIYLPSIDASFSMHLNPTEEEFIRSR